MQDFNDIDDLFRKKLAAREVAYSASAWSDAEKLLNRHYKFLFLKKLLFALVPAAIVSAAGVIYLVNSEPQALQTSKEQAIPQVETPAPEPRPEAETTVVMATPGTINSSRQHGIDESSLDEAVSDNFVSASKRTAERPAIPVVNTSTASRLMARTKAQQILSTGTDEHGKEANTTAAIAGHDVSSTPVTEAGGDKPAAPEASLNHAGETAAFTAPAATTATGNAFYTAEAAEAESFMYGMPKFMISKIGAGNITALSDAERKAGEPLVNKLQKLEVAMEGGALVARGLLNAAPRRDRPSVGVYAALSAQYHVNQTFFIATGAGVFTRGSLAGEQPLPGANGTIIMDPVSLVYLNVPLKLGYRISARHSLAFGMQFSQLLTGISRKETMTNEAATSEWVTDKAGFHGSDVAGLLSYRVSLTEKLDGSAEFQYGLFDITDNQFFRSGDISDRNTLLRLGVSYNIFTR